LLEWTTSSSRPSENSLPIWFLAGGQTPLGERDLSVMVTTRSMAVTSALRLWTPGHDGGEVVGARKDGGAAGPSEQSLAPSSVSGVHNWSSTMQSMWSSTH